MSSLAQQFNTMSLPQPFSEVVNLFRKRDTRGTNPAYFSNTETTGTDSRCVEIPEYEKIDTLESLYTFAEPTWVLRFIRQNASLIPLLIEAHDVIKNEFPKATVMLKMREGESESLLFAYIITSLPTEEAIGKLDRIDDEWFLDKIGNMGGKFNINLAFV